jgi:hypothetical protein
MNVELELFDSGWVDFSVALRQEEIGLLIDRLNELKVGKIKHFHFYRTGDFEVKNGVADIAKKSNGDTSQLSKFGIIQVFIILIEIHRMPVVFWGPIV